jgi:uncharacterized protein
MISKNLIFSAASRIAGSFNPEKIILFGSYARGTADNKSDVDFLIITDFVGSRRKLMVDIDRALRDFKFSLDITVLRPREFEMDRNIPGTIARPAYLEGEILYERN